MLKVSLMALVLLAAPVFAATPLKVENIPDVMQMNNYCCGVACVQAVAQRHGHWGYQQEWAKDLGTSEEQGTHPKRIVRTLKHLGLDASLKENLSYDELKAMIDRGDSVIVDFQAWADDGKRRPARQGQGRRHDYSQEWESGHYCIAVGYDATHIYLEDPSLLGTIGTVKHEDFQARWHDYELESGKRREYVHMVIVVPGKGAPAQQFTPIE